MRTHGSDRGNGLIRMFFCVLVLAGDVPAGAVDIASWRQRKSLGTYMGQFLQDRNFGQNVAIKKSRTLV